MCRAIRVMAGLLAIGTILPAPAIAWGYNGHRFIAERAIDLLPAGIRPFYAAHRAAFVERAIDPDLWRTAGFVEEPPRHFLNLDAYGRFPFTSLPRDYDGAVAAFGREMIVQEGTLPWRIGEVHGQLTRQFALAAERATPLTLEHTRFLSAVLGHYVGDAFMPLHATSNHDGQLSGQRGMHARFETDLFTRFRDRLQLAPRAVSPVASPVNFAFEALVSGFKEVDAVLAADAAATGRAGVHDDAYYERFFMKTKPILERRLSQAIAGVAAAIAGAWEAGGRPALTVRPQGRARRPPGPARKPAA